jgi:hypothetical protein
MSTPKTITIYLPNGEPKGIKVVEMTNRTIRATYIPRNKLAYLYDNSNDYKVALYILYGFEDDTEKVYFGETEDIVKRIKKHNEEKDFWQYAIIITTKDQSFTKTHVKYLEQLCIKEAENINRFKLDNSNSGLDTHAPKSLLADIYDAFETIKIYIGVLGLKVFEKTTTESQTIKKVDIFYYKSKNIDEWDASAEFTEEGLVVRKGSKARLCITNDTPNNVVELRNKLENMGTLERTDNFLVFTKDYVFHSPSLAANTIRGGHNNGWITWVNEIGQNLHDKYRKQN